MITMLMNRLTRLDLPGNVSWFNRPRLGHVMLDFWQFLTLTLSLYWLLMFLCDPLFLGSQQMLPLAGYEFSLASYQF